MTIIKNLSYFRYIFRFFMFQKFRLLHLVNYNNFDTKECYTKPKAVKRWKKKEEKNYNVESL